MSSNAIVQCIQESVRRVNQIINQFLKTIFTSKFQGDHGLFMHVVQHATNPTMVLIGERLVASGGEPTKELEEPLSELCNGR